MRKKLVSYAIIPAFALTLVGAGLASAHGFGSGFNKNLSPEEIAQSQQDRFTEQANLLGISVDEIKNAWAQGKTLQQLATEKGISTDQLKEKMKARAQEKMKSMLQTLVQKGVITQAQADQRLQHMQTQMQNAETKGFGGHKGSMKMMGL
ncbi:MAG: DUF2680 domain-containing protein [Candidatus Doudnabacteria bacterium]|nr:DUF2680 domain-containing protein [Candidatus Doudnabacteria bacterium]